MSYLEEESVLARCVCREVPEAAMPLLCVVREAKIPPIPSSTPVKSPTPAMTLLLPAKEMVSAANANNTKA